MRFIQRASQKYDIENDQFISMVVDGRIGEFKHFLTSYEEQWKLEIDELIFRLESGDIVDKTKLSDVSHQASRFHGLYKRERGELKFIKDLRLSNKKEICPYCGSPGCGTLDHYYPKAQFPQFSVIADNLVPCCYRCNKIKGEYFPINKYDRVINPYFDEFSKKFIFQIEFFDVAGVLFFKLLPHFKLLPVEKEIVKSHIRRMKIKDFHTESVLSTFENERDLVGSMLKEGLGEDVVKRVLKNAVDEGFASGRTYDWSLIVKESIASIGTNFELIKKIKMA
ncbi:MAG: HNH endonuclease [Marinobacter sp.]